MKIERKHERTLDIVLRYSLGILLSLKSLYIFYFVFRPLTFYPASFLLSALYPVQTVGMEKIIIGINEIDFVNACIAGSAFYLLALLNLTTSGISWARRIRIFFVGSVFLLVFNIFRIVLLAAMLVNSYYLFDAAHFIFWYALSIAFVAAIWIFSARFYRIKSIPLWTDINYMRNMIRKRR